jgi:purine-binding chemotaxis protein CheW
MGPLAVAETQEPGTRAPEQQQYLTFQVANEAFALGILSIREIIGFGKLTEVPQMPEFVRGVINLRGAVVPVIDLSARFGKGATAVTRRTCVVIAEVPAGGATQVMGVMVDAVNEVLDIPDAEVEPAPAFGSRVRSDFIRGMGKVEGQFVIVLDIERVLSMDEVTALAAAGEPTGAPAAATVH